MNYHDEIKSMPVEWIRNQLKWTEDRQADRSSCYFTGEDRSYKIRILKEILANHQKELTK